MQLNKLFYLPQIVHKVKAMMTTTMGTPPMTMEPSGISSATTTTTTTTKSRLFSSSSSSSSSASMEDSSSSSSDRVEANEKMIQQPQLDPNQPNLYSIPQNLYPTYRPIPIPIKLCTLLLSLWVSIVTTFKNITWFQPLAVITGMRLKPTIKEWLVFTTKTLLLSLFNQIIIQDLFFAPSRISTQNLQSKYWLPSPLSNYEQIPIKVDNNNNSTATLGVHYLKYENSASSSQLFNHDALYVIHGFGASSLSWLPPLPHLVERFGAKIGLGHDQPGFGFTDRSNDNLGLYTTGSSAMIGTQLIKKNIIGSSSSSSNNNISQKKNEKKLDSIIILGHSLGGITALKMALQLPKETTKHIILSAPALGIRPRPKSKQQQTQKRAITKNFTGGRGRGGFPLTIPWINRKVLHPMGSLLRNTVLYPTGGYILRRVVGGRNFWKNGLRMVWGNPQKVSDSDALRFQWPSIGLGWERGLLEFARAQTSSTTTTSTTTTDDDDVTLLRKVLDLPNTTVAVILGSKDKVVPPSTSYQFFNKDDFPNIQVITLDGLGHDAFEEDIETFINVAEKTVLK